MQEELEDESQNRLGSSKRLPDLQKGWRGACFKIHILKAVSDVLTVQVCATLVAQCVFRVHTFCDTASLSSRNGTFVVPCARVATILEAARAKLLIGTTFNGTSCWNSSSITKTDCFAGFAFSRGFVAHVRGVTLHVAHRTVSLYVVGFCFNFAFSSGNLRLLYVPAAK